MAATIKIKNSSTTGAVPTSGDLVQGELAVNVTDTGLYTENASGTVVKLNAPSIDDKNTGATKHLTISTAGNLGLGVTPSAWNTYKVLEVGRIGNFFAGYNGGTETTIGANAYYNSGWKYAITGALATRYMTDNSGGHYWYTAASGTAGNAISFTQAMTLDASGNLLLNDTAVSSIGSSITTLQLRGKATARSGGVRMLSSDASLDGAIYMADGVFEVNAISSTPIAFRTNSTERARIDSSGNLLVGKTTAAVSTGGAGLWVGPNGFIGVNAANSLADTLNYYNSTAGAYRFYVTNAGVINATSTTITAISDQRLKENIQDIDVGLDAVMALKPRKFDWKEGKGKDKKGDRGWIAQEFEQVFPDMITTWKDAPPEGEEPYKAVNADLIPVLVKAIQELKAEVDALKGTK